MSLSEELREELRSVTRNAYIVNEKRPPSYDRQWKIYAVLKDGSSMFDATKVTEWTRDDDESLHRGIRRVIQIARGVARGEQQ